MTGWLEFDVYGLPAPQGSKRAFVRNGRANLVEVAGESLTIWRHSVTAAARKVIEVEAWEPIREGPIEVHVLFWLPRPKSRQVDVWHATRPDIDKLARATLDALTAASIWHDDCQVAELWVRKRYEVDGHRTPGAMISVREAATE